MTMWFLITRPDLSSSMPGKMRSIMWFRAFTRSPLASLHYSSFHLLVIYRHSNFIMNKMDFWPIYRLSWFCSFLCSISFRWLNICCPIFVSTVQNSVLSLATVSHMPTDNWVGWCLAWQYTDPVTNWLKYWFSHGNRDLLTQKMNWTYIDESLAIQSDKTGHLCDWLLIPDCCMCMCFCCYRNLRKLQLDTTSLASESKNMEEKLKQLKESMSKEKEERRWVLVILFLKKAKSSAGKG